MRLVFSVAWQEEVGIAWMWGEWQFLFFVILFCCFLIA